MKVKRLPGPIIVLLIAAAAGGSLSTYVVYGQSGPEFNRDTVVLVDNVFGAPYLIGDPSNCCPQQTWKPLGVLTGSPIAVSPFREEMQGWVVWEGEGYDDVDVRLHHLSSGFVIDSDSALSGFAEGVEVDNPKSGDWKLETLVWTISSLDEDTQVYARGVFGAYEKIDNFLKAHWKLDGSTPSTTASDSSGNGNTGTLNGAVFVSGSNCKNGNCVLFDGISDDISVPRSSSIEPATAITISAWINPVVAGGPIVDKAFTSHQNPYYSYHIHLEPKTGQSTKAELIFCLNTGGSLTCMGEGSTEVLVTLNTWQFITVTYDGATMKEYVNGVFKKSIAKTGSISYYNTGLKIGEFRNPVGAYKGNIDDMRIYSRALVASEVTSLYNSY